MVKALKKEDIIEAIGNLSVMELADLVKNLEEKFGVSAQAQVVAAAVPGAAAGAPEEEKTSFDLELTDIGSNKIQVIKAVREVTTLGLKEAKEMVEGAPKVFKEGIAKEEAETIKKKFEEVGAKVALK